MKTKVVERSALKGILDEHRRRGERIVFTNGCFDILHVGHLRYLEQARALGDLLVVGINTDESVHRLKGPERPFVPEDERAEMLAGLLCVSYVTFFSEPTPIETIEELKPDIHAKGGDYQVSQLPETRVVESYGGRVAILPLVPGKSTTGLVTHVRAMSREASSCNRAVGVIPSRLASTRLPGKPLLPIAGKPMIQWVYEAAQRAEKLSRVIVATPDEEIARCVESFGGAAAMTSPARTSGTDRVAEVARTVEEDIFVNIQGDEPLLDPSAIDLLVSALAESPDIGMASLMTPILPGEEADPAVVKVVTDKKGFALYFSRSAIPYPRSAGGAPAMKHIGVYAYRRNFLIALAAKEPTPLETAESLEQLRVLESGGSIKMVQVEESAASVDTPEDLLRVQKIMEKMHGARS